MLIPKGTKERLAAPLITVICGLNGILFGVMYAPYQCLVVYKGNFDLMVPWILSGLPYDVTHMIGNLVSSVLVLPLTRLLCRLEGKPYRFAAEKQKKANRI